MTYASPEHGSSRLEDRATPDAQGIIKRYGPNPEARFYKLDQELLRDGRLRPVAKIILIDLFHRANKAERVTSIRRRAAEFGVSHETLADAEQELVRGGYLLRSTPPGKIPYYLAAYPPIPESHDDRPDFEGGFVAAYDVEPDAAQALKTTPYGKSVGSEPYGKSVDHPTENPEGPYGKSVGSHVLKKEEGKKREEAAPPASLLNQAPEPEELWPQRGPRLTEAQSACIRELTEQVMATRSDCREGEGEMWLALFDDGLTVERTREVVLAARLRPGFKRPRSMVYFRSMLREALAEGASAVGGVSPALAEARRRLAAGDFLGVKR